jgi:hypothetical protein
VTLLVSASDRLSSRYKPGPSHPCAAWQVCQSSGVLGELLRGSLTDEAMGTTPADKEAAYFALVTLESGMERTVEAWQGTLNRVDVARSLLSLELVLSKLERPETPKIPASPPGEVAVAAGTDP